MDPVNSQFLLSDAYKYTYASLKFSKKDIDRDITDNTYMQRESFSMLIPVHNETAEMSC